MPSKKRQSGQEPALEDLETPMTTVDPAKELLFARPGFLVRRLHQIHVAMFFEECKSQNVTPVQYAILTAVSVLPDLDQTSLGQEVGLDRTTTADVVKRPRTAASSSGGRILRQAHAPRAPDRRRAERWWTRCAATWPAPRSACWRPCVRPSARC